jgi:hypothetical protein
MDPVQFQDDGVTPVISTPPTLETVTPLEAPPVTPPAVPSIDWQAIAKQQQAVLAEQTQLTQKALSEIKSIKDQLNTKPELTAKESSEQFFANPGRMISDEIAKQLAPLNETRKQMERDNKYGTLKLQMKRDPRFTALQNANVEAALDQLVADHNEFNVQLIVRDYYTALGTVAASGDFSATPPAPATPPTPPTPAVITPPHLRPSSPPPRDTSRAAVPTRELTENERKLARLYGMTDAEYVAGQGTSDDMTLDTFSPPKGGK